MSGSAGDPGMVGMSDAADVYCVPDGPASSGTSGVGESLDPESAVLLVTAVAMEVLGGAGAGAGAGVTGSGGNPDLRAASSWRFSGRWWAAPLTLRRSRPIKR
jgi:hypothetical protein